MRKNTVLRKAGPAMAGAKMKPGSAGKPKMVGGFKSTGQGKPKMAGGHKC